MTKSVTTTKFAIKPVVTALALAFTAANVYADPTPTQLPGSGLIRNLSTGTAITSPAGFYFVSGTGNTGDVVVNGSPGAPNFPGSVQLNSTSAVARAVIRWGGNGFIGEVFNPDGFNIGQNATFYYTSGTNVTSAAVLNIDASGNPSQIFGRLIGTSDVNLGTTAPIAGVGGGAAPAIFVANTNGIIVGPLGQVQSPTGVALIGANLNNNTASYEFVANNGAATSYLDVTGSLSKVDVRGFIDGGGNNQPAGYVLLVGSDVVNSGNIFGTRVTVMAGVRGYASTTASDTVNGVSKVSVQRLFNVDTPFMVTSPTECATSDACLEIANPGSTFVNTGSLQSKGIGTGAITLLAAKGIRNGILGDPNPLVGIFSDNGVATNVYEAGGNTELYSVIAGYSTGVNLPFLQVNPFAGWDGDVVLNALTRGSAPSSITTFAGALGVDIRGVNVTINSTINHTENPLSDGDLRIRSTNSLTITKAVGAGDNVTLSNSGAGGINISANVFSELDGDSNGEIGVFNTGSNSPTTISAPSGVYGLLAAGTGIGDVTVSVNGDLTIMANVVSGWHNTIINNNKNGATTLIGPGAVVGAQTGTIPFAFGDTSITVSGPMVISGFVGSVHDVNITNNSLAGGNTTTISGSVLAFNDINIRNNGGTTSKLYIDGPVSAVAQWDGDSQVNIFSGGDLRLGAVASVLGSSDVNVQAMGLNSALTNAILAEDVFNYNAPNARTQVWTDAVLTAPTMNITALNFKGVQNGGADYTAAGQKPATQLNVDNLNLLLYGSFNAPIVGNTNWLLNSMWATPIAVGSPVFASITASGAGTQAINLAVNGSLVVDSGLTLTPFFLVGLNSPVIIPPFLIGNGGSSMLLHATENMDINPGFVPGLAQQFLFPGGLAFKADTGYLSINAPINNAWTFTPVQFQGQWFEAPTIIDSGYHATNQGSWVNYSSYPVSGPGNAYTIAEPSPGVFQFVPQPFAIHYNVYSTAILGAPQCVVGNPPAPWPPAGC